MAKKNETEAPVRNGAPGETSSWTEGANPRPDVLDDEDDEDLVFHMRRILSDRRLSAQEAMDKLHALFVEGRPLGEMPIDPSHR